MDQVGMEDPAPTEEEDEDEGENAEAGKKPHLLGISSKSNLPCNSVYRSSFKFNNS